MKGYIFWVYVGVFSGLLWGINNFLIAFSYEEIRHAAFWDTLDYQAINFTLPLVIATGNDISAAISLLISYGFLCQNLKVIRQRLWSKEGLVLIMASLLGGPLGQFFYCKGIAEAGPAYALAITSLYPIIGCFFSRVFLHQTITFWMWSGIVLAVTGTVIIGHIPLSSGAEPWKGMVFSLCAAICWGSEIVLAVWGMKSVSPQLAITFRYVVSGTILAMVGFPFWGGADIAEHLLVPNILRWIIIAGFVAGASYACWYASNFRVGCARGMAMNSTFIVWGILLQVLFGDSTNITAHVCLGSLLVLIGVVMTILSPRGLWKKENKINRSNENEMEQ